MKIDEEIAKEQGQKSEEALIKRIQAYDAQIFPKMKAEGWTSNGLKPRTMTFDFGTVTFKRRQWLRNGKLRTPVDEHFNFEKYQRVSFEVLVQAAKVAAKTTYRNTQQILWELAHVDVSTWTVSNAVGKVANLLEEREEYRYLDEKYEGKKKEVQLIYIDADGVMLRSKHPNEEGKYWSDYAHFAVHFGMKVEGKKDRYKCVGKKEFFGKNVSKVRAQLVDYLWNHYEITKDALVVTNSDGGYGYTPTQMRNLVKSIGGGRHEHFWDRYHFRKKIDDKTKNYPESVGKAIHRAISTRDYDLLVNTLALMKDTVESLEENEINLQRQEELEKFTQKLISNWDYTKSPNQRGISRHGISFIESNHRKITYRAKNRGMYWSERNAIAIAHLIILQGQNELDELFHGKWREIYEKFHEIDSGGIHRRLKTEEKIRGQQMSREKLGTVTTRF